MLKIDVEPCRIISLNLRQRKQSTWKTGEKTVISCTKITRNTCVDACCDRSTGGPGPRTLEAELITVYHHQFPWTAARSRGFLGRKRRTSGRAKNNDSKRTDLKLFGGREAKKKKKFSISSSPRPWRSRGPGPPTVVACVRTHESWPPEKIQTTKLLRSATPRRRDLHVSLRSVLFWGFRDHGNWNFLPMFLWREEGSEHDSIRCLNFIRKKKEGKIERSSTRTRAVHHG